MSSNYPKAFVQCCHGKYTVASSRTLLYNHVLLPATANVLETFLQAILWTPFQLFRRIINYVNKSAVSSVLISVEGTCKYQLEPGRVELQCCHIVVCLTNSDRCAGALLWRRNQLSVLHLLGHSLLTATVRWRMKSMCVSLFTIAIPVNYTNELWEIFAANAYSSEASFIFGSWHWNRFHNN